MLDCPPQKLTDPMLSNNPEKTVYMDLVALSLQTFGLSNIRPDR